MANNNTTSLNIVGFNCQGIKSNLNYIDFLLNLECNILFTCEHWLKPSELYEAQSSFREQQLWCNLKSSIPADEILAGRPYGGVGFVCKQIPSFTLKDVPNQSDRISVLEVTQNGHTVLTVIGAYLPYHCANSAEAYSETLDQVYSIMESTDSPVVLVGDMNAHLPYNSNLTTNWYKQRPFNRHSLLLHDLICDNNMISANYHYRQKLDYTYFKGHCRSYIDHIFTSEHLIDCLVNCEILDHHSYNTSDHLPVKVHIKLPCDTCDSRYIERDNTCGESETIVKNTIIDWTKLENRVRFLEQIRLNENKIDDAIFNKCSGADQAQVIVDRICNNIINCITNACPNKDSSPSTSHRRKPW